MRLFKGLPFLVAAAATAGAGDLTVAVSDQNGKPVLDAVVYALPVAGQPPSRRTQSEVVQRNKQFIPYVSAVQAGSLVQFPNKDTVKHHVYSFSPAKKFELPLYAGTPPEPIARYTGCRNPRLQYPRLDDRLHSCRSDALVSGHGFDRCSPIARSAGGKL